jgi:hypothetical protein
MNLDLVEVRNPNFDFRFGAGVIDPEDFRVYTQDDYDSRVYNLMYLAEGIYIHDLRRVCFSLRHYGRKLRKTPLRVMFWCSIVVAFPVYALFFMSLLR